MIAKLSGTVIDVRTNHIVLDVQGVGYLIAVRSTEAYTEGSKLSLHTHLAVRENALDLYGFATIEAFTMFEHLIKLPKIGPKTALQILSQADVDTLKKAVHTNDPVYLSKVSGMSKKSAEKVVAGLKDVLHIDDVEYSSLHHAYDGDVIDALVTLGYSQKDASEALQKIPTDVTDTNTRIKLALKHIR